MAVYDLEREQKDSKASDTVGDLAAAEKDAGQPSAAEADSKEQGLFSSTMPSDQVGAGYREQDKRRNFLGRFSRRQKAAGGGVIGVVVGIICALFFFHGPLEIVHFAQLLKQFHFSNNEELADGRTTRFLRNLYKNRPQRSRLNALGNKFADKYELRMQERIGMRSVYDGTTGRFLGYEIIDPDKARPTLQEMEKEGIKPQDGPPANSNARAPDGSSSTGRMVNLSEQRFRSQRSVIRTVSNGTGTRRLSGALSSRLLIRRAGVDFHPLRNIARKSGESLLDFYRARREARADSTKNGVTTPTAGIADPDDPDGDGPTGDSTEAANQGNGAVGDATGEGTISERADKIKGRMIGVAGFIGVMCTLRELGNQAEATQHAQIVLPLIRTGTRVVTTGYQIMSGQDVNVDELGSVSADLYDEEFQTSWAAARSIQAESGEELTGPDIPDEAKPSNVGEKPAFFAFVDKVFSLPGAGAACSGIGQGILNVVDFGGFALDKIREGAFALLNVADPEDVLAERIVRVLAGEEIDDEAAGAVLGNYANYGARLAANDQAIAMGGRPLSGTEVAELDALARESRLADQRQQGVFARVFNVYDANSVVATMSRKVPRNMSQVASFIAKVPSTIIGSLFQPVKAADEAYDYGFPEYGFSSSEQDAEKFDDPDANGVYERVEANLEYLNVTYGPCFSTTVTLDRDNPEAIPQLVTGDAARYDQIEKDPECTSEDELLREYRFYIADTITAHTLACYEGEEDSCRQLGFGSVTVGASPAGEAKGVDTSDQECTVGSDAGIGETPDPNIKIRLCKVANLTVNVAIEKNVDAIVKGSASAGLEFGEGEGYRPPGVQVQRRIDNCGSSHYDIYEKPANDCNPPTAKPGESLHEWGLAVDFRCNGSIIGSRSSACFQWLANNTSLHNLRNLPSEPWHWSTSGG